jgi:hypothetical protein
MSCRVAVATIRRAGWNMLQEADRKCGAVQTSSPLLPKFLLSFHGKAGNPSRARLVKPYIHEVRTGQGGDVSGTPTPPIGRYGKIQCLERP